MLHHTVTAQSLHPHYRVNIEGCIVFQWFTQNISPMEIRQFAIWTARSPVTYPRACTGSINFTIFVEASIFITNLTLSLSVLCKRITTNLMHFHYMTNMATPITRNPYSGVMRYIVNTWIQCQHVCTALHSLRDHLVRSGK